MTACVLIIQKNSWYSPLLIWYSCFLIYTSIIQRANDLLKEQLYKDYDVVYFQNANSRVVTDYNNNKNNYFKNSNTIPDNTMKWVVVSRSGSYLSCYFLLWAPGVHHSHSYMHLIYDIHVYSYCACIYIVILKIVNNCN